ncbi:uncharacterized protein LOC114282213 [Camellia sinensis]|uniref:uncharacterized protein LOC114282213 n=1 Tax=Camellia sinensis TaxID=4442 RepID=UPI001036B4A0|nr:uncharacterized protein LOC114282213 [Camellia sinensis]
MKDFNEFIDKLKLSDLPMLGRQFTWCYAIDGERCSRIDRFLLDSRWLEKFSFKQWGLPRSISDHCPILLKGDERDWGLKPFKFLNPWLSYPTFMPEVKQLWENDQSVEEEVHDWDLKAESRTLADVELRKCREARSLMWKLSKDKERLWLQKSRMLWARNGDKNTRFFHLMASRRQMKNMLDSICVEEVTFEDPF